MKPLFGDTVNLKRKLFKNFGNALDFSTFANLFLLTLQLKVHVNMALRF